MAKSFVELGVKDSGFNASIKNAIHTFASLSGAANSAKGAFKKFADGLTKVAQSQELVNNALKGNPYGLLAQVATTAFTKIIEKATEATDAEKLALAWAEEKAERTQTANEAIGRSTGELMAKYELLRYEWGRLSSVQEKNEWIKQNQSAFKGLNLAVNDVTSAENAFVKNTSQVVAALKARAEAEAYADLYKNKIKENAMNKANGKYKPQLITDKYYRPSGIEAQAAGFNAGNKRQMYEYTTRKVMGRDGKYHDYTEWTGRLSDEGLRRLNQNRVMGANTLENADRLGAEYWANLMVQAQKNATDLGKGLFGGGGSGSGGRSGRSGKSKGFDISSIAFDANKAMLSAVKSTDDGPSEIWKAITEGAKESTSSVEDLTDAFQKLNKVQGVTAKDADKDSGNLADNWRNAGTAIGAVGAAMSQIEDPAAKVMGTIAQAIATIALTYAASLKGTFTPWDWIAGAAAGAAAMVSVISTIHSATGYAQGGIVKGNSYSGDNIYGGPDAMVNAGELVLTKAQQSTLASQLQNNGSTVNVVGRVVGEDIFLSADRYARRSGRGSILTGKNL